MYMSEQRVTYISYVVNNPVDPRQILTRNSTDKTYKRIPPKLGWI